jgi:hypothetical protein
LRAMYWVLSEGFLAVLFVKTEDCVCVQVAWFTRLKDLFATLGRRKRLSRKVQAGGGVVDDRPHPDLSRMNAV